MIFFSIIFKTLKRSLKARQERGRVSSTDVETEVYDVMKDDKEKGGKLNTKAAWQRARGKLVCFIYKLYSILSSHYITAP